MNRTEIANWLRETRPKRLAELWHLADETRRKNVGDGVFLRGLIELSNHCRRRCLYCGIRADNGTVTRYRMTPNEVVETAILAKKLGYGTVVIQSGEDFSYSKESIAEIIERVKNETDIIVTLSLGERPEEDWLAWKKAGANRYLLRFETSSPALYRAIHPSAKTVTSIEVGDRLTMLKTLREIGYEIGSGVMTGLPGQSWDDLAADISLFGELALDMIGCGPFLPHPQTPIGKYFPPNPKTGLCTFGELSEPQKTFCAEAGIPMLDPAEQVVCDAELPFKVIALTRLVCPKANIPSTTAIATVDPVSGRKLGLSRGANVIMPNLTPTQYRKLYSIYPNKAASTQSAEETDQMARQHILEIGRFPR